jgi:sulfofructose kinase
MDGLQIVGVGRACFDVLIRLRDLPTWEHGTRFSALSIDGGGPVGTACVAAARLGARVGFVGTAGSDEFAESKLRSFARDGVDLSHLRVRNDIEHDLVLVWVHEDSGERVFSHFQSFGESPLRPEDLDRSYVTSAEYLLLDGAHEDAAVQAARWMRELGKQVMLDAWTIPGFDVHPKFRRLIPESDILIAGSGLVPALTGRQDVWEAGRAALALGPRIVVQTQGAAGSYTVTADEEFHTPAFSVPVMDTTGAGDVFHGAYLVGLLRGWDLRRVATFATAVSSIQCTRMGGRAGIPRYPEVVAFLRERGVDIE